MGNRSLRRTEALAEAPFKGHMWDRQAQPPWKESPKAHEAFKIFRDMTGARRVLTVAAHTYADRYGLSRVSCYQTLSRWRRQYRWDERIAAYDNMMDAQELAARKREIIRVTREHADVQAAAQEALMEPLRVYRERLVKIAAGLRVSDFEAVDEDGKEVFSDADLQEIGRATLKVIMESQRSQREALQIEPAANLDRSRIEARGAILRRVFKDASAREQLEEIAFVVAAEEQRGEKPA
jgi:hypothetical protein